MTESDTKAESFAVSEYRRQAGPVPGGLAPFSIGYGYIKFRGQKLASSEVERFSVSPWSVVMPLACILLFVVSWLFLKTPIPLLDGVLTALLGTNAFLVSVRFFRPGGLRLFILHRRDGRSHFAFVGVYTAEAMIRMWDDILVVMPDMAGRTSE